MRIGTWVNKRVGLGLLLSVLLCVVGAALGALLESKEILQESQEGVWMCVTWAVAAFAGCRFSLQNTEGRLAHIAVQARCCILQCGAERWPPEPICNLERTGGILQPVYGAGRWSLPYCRRERKRKEEAERPENTGAGRAVNRQILQKYA